MMGTQRTIDEADIRRRMDKWAKAIRAMDVEGVASSYAPDITSFDVGPLLRQLGAGAKRQNWVGLFAMFQRPLDYEIRDLTIAAGDEVAFGTASIALAGPQRMGRGTMSGSASPRASERSTVSGSSRTITSLSPLIRRVGER
jgi:ketosteroid isomerase-like protein